MDDEIIRVSHETFMSDYAPPELPGMDDIVKRCIAALEARDSGPGVLQRSKKGVLRFRRFLKAPSKLKGNEKKVFSHMGPIWNGVKSVEVPGRPSILTYCDTPDSTTASETPGSSHKGDAHCRYPTSPDADTREGKVGLKENPIFTYEDAVGFSYKKRATPENRADDATQALSGATHVMNDDPTRNWTYSITIEDSEVRIWYWGRSHSVVSTPIDFVSDVEGFIKIVARFMFASPLELGYNPHMKRCFDSQNRVFYIYDVGGKFYKTLDSVYEQRSLNISSRATRVWKVRRVVSRDDHTLHPDDPREHALRDVWLERTADTEKETQSKIFADIDAFIDRTKDKSTSDIPELAGFNASDQVTIRQMLGNYKQYFLTIIDERSDQDSGSLSKPLTQDPHRRQVCNLFVKPEVETKAAAVKSEGRESSQTVPSSLRDATKGPKTAVVQRAFEEKKRTFEVYDEFCVALHSLQSLHDIFTAMIGCLCASIIMLLAGWIHRDISTGNLLAYICGSTAAGGTRSVLGKLGDLEYAKKISRLSSIALKDPKTGTAFFMAIEVQSSRRIYFPDNMAPRELALKDGIFDALIAGVDDTSLISQDEEDSAAVLSEPMTVPHSFLHDMESYFWIILWVFTGFVLHKRSRKWAKEVFVNSNMCSLRRQTVFLDPTYLGRVLAEENGIFLPALQEKVNRVKLPKEIDSVRHNLLRLHTNQSRPLSERAGTAASSIMKLLGTARLVAKNVGEGVKVSLVNLPSTSAEIRIAAELAELEESARKEEEIKRRKAECSAAVGNITGRRKRQRPPQDPSDLGDSRDSDATQRSSKAPRSGKHTNVKSVLADGR